MPGLRKGHQKHTAHGRSYEVLAGPFDTNDGRNSVYVIREKDDGLVRLMAARHLEELYDDKQW